MTMMGMVITMITKACSAIEILTRITNYCVWLARFESPRVATPGLLSLRRARISVFHNAMHREFTNPPLKCPKLALQRLYVFWDLKGEVGMRIQGYFLSVVCVLILCASVLAEQPFFAFDNAFRQEKLPISEQAAILAELGYNGIGYTGTQNIPQALSALKAHNLRMFSTYVSVDLSADGARYDPDLPKAIQQLKGEGTILWLYVRSKEKPLTLDDRAVTAIRDIARMAEESGLQVALYPHYGFYVSTIEDAMRVAQKVDRENVGVSFNLCHFLKQHDEEEIQTKLAGAMPHLFLVSINGVDRGDTKSMSWDRLIQPLGKGDFAVEKVLRILRQEKYSGAIGLQCYAIPSKPQEHLSQSIEAWRTLAKQLDDEK